MFGEHVGEGLFQLKFTLGGTEVRLMFVATPAQMVFGEGGLTTGTGWIVMASDEVTPGARQLELVPYTCRLPEVALSAKSTVTKLSVRFAWCMVAPVPV